MKISSQTTVLCGAIAGMLIGFCGVYTAPFLIGFAMTSLGLSAGQSGWLAFAVVAAVAAGSSVATLLLKTPHQRVTLIICTSVAVASHAASTQSVSLLVLIVLQTIGNFAGGIVSGITAARIAATPDADRGYARMFAVASFIFAAMLYVLPQAEVRWGPHALFGVSAVLQLLVLPVLWWDRIDHAAVSVQLEAATVRTRQRPGMVLVFFAAMTIGFLNYGGVYGFSERVAGLLHISAEDVGLALSASTALAICGAAVANALGARWGRALPLCGSLVVSGGSYVLILGAREPATWVFGLALYGFVSIIFTTYSYATAAAMDPTGRLVSVLQGYVLVPYALGPAVLGGLVRGEAFHDLAWPTLAANVLAATLVAPVVMTMGSDRLGARGAVQTTQ